MSKFDIVPVAGRGLGLVANAAIKKGECVLREKPLFRLPPFGRDLEANGAALTAKVSELDGPTREAYFALSTRPGSGSRESAVFHSNFFSLGVSDSVDGEADTGVLLIGARINFDCRPNLNHCWNEREGVVTFMAIEDIAIGQELTIYFSYPFSTKAERGAIYLKAHRFVCSCKVCSASPAKIKLSDTRRIGLKQAINAMGMLGLSNPEMSIALARQVLATCKLEKIVVQTAGIADIAVDICAAFCDFESSKKWATVALELHLLEAGETEESETSRAYMKDPTSNSISRMGKKALLLGGP